jgi:hypothetical protein
MAFDLEIRELGEDISNLTPAGGCCSCSCSCCFRIRW